jgi:hypothetical protein
MPRGVQLSQANPLTSQLQLPKQQSSWWSGKTPDLVSVNQYNPQQQGVLSNLLNSGQQQLNNPYQGFEPIKQDALNTFFQDIVPRLQEQFSASGSNSASSGTLKSELSGAGSGLAERLAAFQAHFGQQNQQNGLQQLQLGLNPHSEFINRPGGGGVKNNIRDLLTNAIPALGYLGGGYLAGRK